MTKWEKFTAWLAVRIVSHVACNINANAVLALCVSTAKLYHERYPNND
jgi:hypothetical protein